MNIDSILEKLTQVRLWDRSKINDEIDDHPSRNLIRFLVRIVHHKHKGTDVNADRVLETINDTRHGEIKDDEVILLVFKALYSFGWVTIKDDHVRFLEGDEIRDYFN